MYRNGDAGGYDADVCPAVGGTGGQRPVRRSPPCQGMQQLRAKFCMLLRIKMFKNVVVIMFIAIQLYLQFFIYICKIRAKFQFYYDINRYKRYSLL